MKTTVETWMRLAAALATAALLGCVKGETSQSSDSTARNLTLAPAESTAALKDVPARAVRASGYAPSSRSTDSSRPSHSRAVPRWPGRRQAASRFQPWSSCLHLSREEAAESPSSIANRLSEFPARSPRLKPGLGEHCP